MSRAAALDGSRQAPRRVLIETAPAKVNLSLSVLGRRPDGYHKLESLVAFAGVADELSLDLSLPLGLRLGGPEAAGIEGGGNLVLEAARGVAAASSLIRVGEFRLEKVLPVAAGLGGGSADAAAALRLLARANPQAARSVDWMTLAAGIGSDVPVCLQGCAAMMTGRGERVTPLGSLPSFWLVLANPRVALPTADVFHAHAAGARAMAMADGPGDALSPPRLPDLPALLAYLRARPNDLEPAAIGICPSVAVALDALARLDGALLARMSGSGATCFAIFASAAPAVAGATALARAQPQWWVQAAPVL